METYNDDKLINISSGTETSIKDLVEMIAKIIGYRGRITWDFSKPDGQMRKIFDTRRMKEILKFECNTSIEEGLGKTIKWFEENYPEGIRL